MTTGQNDRVKLKHSGLLLLLCVATFATLARAAQSSVVTSVCDPSLVFWLPGTAEIEDVTGHIAVRNCQANPVVCGLSAYGRDDVCNFTGSNWLTLDETGIQNWLPKGKQPRTVCAWAASRNTIGAGNAAWIFSYGYPFIDREFFIANDGDDVYVGAYSDDFDTDWNMFVAGSWVHVCLTWQLGTNNMIVYINGGGNLRLNYDGMGHYTLATTKNNWNTQAVQATGVIGAQLNTPYDPWLPWDGYISDVQVYSKVLTDYEVYQIYQRQKTTQRDTSCAPVQCEKSLKMWLAGNEVKETARPETPALATPNGTVFSQASYFGRNDVIMLGPSSWVDIATSYISANFPASARPRAVCLWSNTNQSTHGTFISYGDPPGASLARPAMYLANTAADQLEGNMLETQIWTSNEWARIPDSWEYSCISYDGNATFGGTNTATLYVSGAMQHSASPTGTYNNAATNFIGRVGAYLASPPNLQYSGAMYDLRVFDRALTLQDVQNLTQQTARNSRKRYCQYYPCPASLVFWQSGRTYGQDESPNKIAVSGVSEDDCGLSYIYMRYVCFGDGWAIDTSAVNAYFPKSSNDRSVCFMYNRNNAGTTDYIISWGSSAVSQEMSFYFSGASQNFTVFGPDGSSHVWGWASLTWTHVCHTYTAGTSKIYWNGVLRSTASKTWTIPTSGLTAYVGWKYNGAGGYFHGAWADLRVYNKTLSDTEVAAIYDMSFSPTSPSQGGLYRPLGCAL